MTSWVVPCYSAIVLLVRPSSMASMVSSSSGPLIYLRSNRGVYASSMDSSGMNVKKDRSLRVVAGESCSSV